MCAEQIRLHAEQIPIAAGKLKNCFDPRLLLQKDWELQRAHPQTAMTVRNVDDVDSAYLECACLLDDVVADKALRREQFDNRREPPGGKCRREVRFLRPRNGRGRRLMCRVQKDPASTVD